MAAGNKSLKEKKPDTSGSGHSMRDDAEEQLAHSQESSSDLKGQTPEQLIHELQVHQIELEMQADELRRAHLALEESRDKYLDLYEFAPLGYLSLTDKGLISDVNLTGASLLGIERNNLLRAPFSKFMSEKDSDTWHRYFLNVLNHEEKQSCTLMLKRGDSSPFPARLESIRIPGKTDGAPTVRVAISDITDIRRVEDALRVSNKKLTLLSSITRHDINNQLLTLNGFLGLLQSEVTDPKHEGYFTRITKAIDQITAMIRFTKEYEKIGANAPFWQDCRKLVDTAAKQASFGQVVLKNDLPDGFEVFADPLMVKVCYNMMDNAVRYGGKITTLRFSALEREGDHIVVCEDDGEGVVANEKEMIFKRGFGKNTGLGLTLAREILDITGITIRETGEPGKGARFEMRVPEGAYRLIEVK
ncbi:MAG: PAS domain-containing sensor histidine kinase [Methanoregula sp.]|nr:PAS domain-containing sensor histidine kinase [Methanoregula sp.]